FYRLGTSTGWLDQDDRGPQFARPMSVVERPALDAVVTVPAFARVHAVVHGLLVGETAVAGRTDDRQGWRVRSSGNEGRQSGFLARHRPAPAMNRRLSLRNNKSGNKGGVRVACVRRGQLPNCMSARIVPARRDVTLIRDAGLGRPSPP